MFFRISSILIVSIMLITLGVIVMQAKETQPQNLVNQTAKEEKLKEISRLFVEEAWHKGNLNFVDEHFTDAFVRHAPPYPDKDKEAYKQHITDTRNSYPDVHVTIDEIIVEGDIIAMRWTFRGTQTGPSPVLGTPPTGKKITFTGCTVAHFVDGKTVETWEYTDWLSLMQQLGFKVVPPQ